MVATPEINVETVTFLIEKAREFETPEMIVEDQESVSVPRDPSFAEAKAQIEALDVDQQCALVALAWVGRGAYEPDEWEDALAEARAAHNTRTAEYLFGMPNLAENLEAGLDVFEIPARVES
jgi:hypothetical protein